MRTTKLKIGNEKKEALLIAGGTGFKVYSAVGIDGWVLVVGRRVRVFSEQSDEFKTIARYVNLRYQPANMHDAIKSEFNALVASQAAEKRAPLIEPEL